MDSLLGLHTKPEDLTLVQMCLRGFIIFVLTLVYIRVAGMRTFGKNNAIDIIIGLILGSVLSRAVNGSAAFFPTLGVSFLLVLLHRVAAYLCFENATIGRLFKGSSSLVYGDGKILHENLKKHNISENDLIEGIRQTSNIDDFTKIDKAYFERTGVISVVKK